MLECTTNAGTGSGPLFVTVTVTVPIEFGGRNVPGFTVKVTPRSAICVEAMARAAVGVSAMASQKIGAISVRTVEIICSTNRQENQ